MKPVSRRPWRIVLVASLLLNVFVTLPALAIFALSDGIRLYIYEQVADRIGDTDIAFIGDSITRDGGIWGVRIGRPFFRVRNLAYSGSYTEQMVYQAHSAVSEEARLAFVMAGINDVPKTAAGSGESFEAYVRILEVLQEGGVEPVIQSTLYREGGEDHEFVTRLNELLHGYAAENGIEFLDLNVLLSSGERLKPEFSRDGTHLTGEAYREWAKEIRDFLDR